MQGVNNTIVAILLATIGELAGPGAPRAVVVAAGDARTVDECVDPEGWSTPEQVRALFEAAAEVTGMADIAWRAGTRALTGAPGLQLRGLLRTLRDPGSAFVFIADHFGARSTVSELTCQAIAERSMVLALRTSIPVHHERILCEYVGGLFSVVPTVFGAPSAEVIETRCQSHGDHACRFEVRWAVVEVPGAGRAVSEGGTGVLAVPGAGGAVPGAGRAVPAVSEDLVLATVERTAVAPDAASVADQLAKGVSALVGGRLGVDPGPRTVVLRFEAVADRLVEAGRVGRRPMWRSTGAASITACRGLAEQLARRGHMVPMRVQSTEPVVQDICRLAGFTEGWLVPLVAEGRCLGVVAVEGETGVAESSNELHAVAAASAAALLRIDLRRQAARPAPADQRHHRSNTDASRTRSDPVGTARLDEVDTGRLDEVGTGRGPVLLGIPVVGTGHTELAGPGQAETAG